MCASHPSLTDSLKTILQSMFLLDFHLGAPIWHAVFKCWNMLIQRLDCGLSIGWYTFGVFPFWAIMREGCCERLWIGLWLCATWASWVNSEESTPWGMWELWLAFRRATKLFFQSGYAIFASHQPCPRSPVLPHCQQPVSPRCTLTFSSKNFIILVLAWASPLRLEWPFVHLVWKESSFTCCVWLFSCPRGTYWKD